MKKEYRAMYNAMYDKLAPLKSDEELLNSVLSSRKGNITMKHENKSRKLFSKAVVIPLAAALALGATAVGAVAVYNRNVAEEYANVLQKPDGFDQDYKTADGEEVNLNAVALSNGLYDELNIEINKTFEYEDFTLEFPGAVCDGRDILIMYNMTFKNDLDCLRAEHQNFWLWGPNETNDDDGLHGGTRANNGIMSEVDGKKVYSGYVDYSGVENCGESLNLHFEEISSSTSNRVLGIKLYNVDIDVDLDIPLTGDFSKFNKTVEADTAQHVDLLGWGEWDVESVDISSLLITFNVKTDGDLPAPDGNIFKEGMMVFPINVTMKDGSTLDLGSKAIYRYGDDPETKTGWFMAVLNYPLDVDNVQSVQFASAVIDIDGTATTIEIPEVYSKYDENGRPVER